MVRITVDRQQILLNRNRNGNRPVWCVERDGKTERVHGLTLRNARLVSAEGGTACWIEARAEDIECLEYSTPT